MINSQINNNLTHIHNQANSYNYYSPAYLNNGLSNQYNNVSHNIIPSRI